VNALLNSPAGLQALGRITTARSKFSRPLDGQYAAPQLVSISCFRFDFAGVFGAAIALPTVRPLAYAPVRDLILPPPEPIVVSLLYTTEKTDWLNEVVPEFEATHPW